MRINGRGESTGTPGVGEVDLQVGIATEIMGVPAMLL